MSTQGNPDPSRRRLLSAALYALLSAGVLGGCAGWPAREPRPLSARELAAMIGDRDAASRFGEAYLRDFPAERDLDVLSLALTAALPAPGDAGLAFDDLDRVVREEYRRGDVVRVAGWLVSRSEARLYAAASLL